MVQNTLEKIGTVLFTLLKKYKGTSDQALMRGSALPSHSEIQNFPQTAEVI